MWTDTSLSSVCTINVTDIDAVITQSTPPSVRIDCDNAIAFLSTMSGRHSHVHIENALVSMRSACIALWKQFKSVCLPNTANKFTFLSHKLIFVEEESYGKLNRRDGVCFDRHGVSYYGFMYAAYSHALSPVLVHSSSFSLDPTVS